MIVEVENLCIKAGKKKIVDNVCLNAAEGERVGLIGVSGSGKSMICKALTGLLPPGTSAEGTVRLGGKNIVGEKDSQIAKLRGRYAGMILQNNVSALNPVKNIGENVSMPLKNHFRLSSQNIRKRVAEALESVGLESETAFAYPHELSGGQAQRAGIAAAVISKPKLIIADEPTASLDAVTGKKILDLLVSAVDGYGGTLLFVSHDFSQIRRAAKRCYVIEDGKIAEENDTEKLFESPCSEAAKSLIYAAKCLHISREDKF